MKNKPANKVVRLNGLQKILKRRRKKRLVFTNGCFDILHAGHVRYLQKAKEKGDLLVVGLNSDASTQRLKGKNRPINPQADRAKVLAALACVDYVVVFDQETPERLIAALKPSVLVKGGDWPLKKIVGREFVESCGGKVLVIPLLKGRSTTSILKKTKRHF
ncbi:MAG: D-glycero-beta-D-manno-heptose 1-phosphate adenylyltransferase [Candidatus Omnitrophota bacterium]